MDDSDSMYSDLELISFMIPIQIHLNLIYGH